MNGLYHLFILQVTFGMMRCEILMTTDAQEVYNTTATIRQQLPTWHYHLQQQQKQHSSTTSTTTSSSSNNNDNNDDIATAIMTQQHHINGFTMLYSR